jgi:hypothetical protein
MPQGITALQMANANEDFRLYPIWPPNLRQLDGGFGGGKLLNPIP